MKRFGVIETALTSPPDREHVVVELILVRLDRRTQIAEVRWERKEYLIELYAPYEGNDWDIPVADFREALDFAVAVLEERYGLQE